MYVHALTTVVLTYSWLQLVMIEERRWPLGNKMTDLDAGCGIISTIKWKENLLAWANDRVSLFPEVGLVSIIQTKPSAWVMALGTHLVQCMPHSDHLCSMYLRHRDVEQYRYSSFSLFFLCTPYLRRWWLFTTLPWRRTSHVFHLRRKGYLIRIAYMYIHMYM